MPEILVQNSSKCYHCGDECDGHQYLSDEKTFCCDGCKLVYELLHNNDLCTYYDLSSAPGIKVKGKTKEKYAYLDNESIVDAISDFNDGKIVYITLYIPSIHCASCVWLLESLNKLKSGVITSRVNFAKREFSVSFHKDKVSLRELVEIIDSFGYPPELNLENYTKTKSNNKRESIIYKIGIAAFCSGNIMLFSFPAYFGLDSLQEESFIKLFGYLSMFFSFPVIFYSSQDFFISAYAGFKRKKVNLDVPIAIGITAVFFRSIYEVLLNIGPGYFDSLTGLIFFMLIGKWIQQKTYTSFSFDRDYKSYFPISVLKIIDSFETYVPVGELKVGDVFMVRNQELVPVDSVLLSNNAQINYSFVTGESNPLQKSKGDLIYAGGKQEGEYVLLKAEKVVSQSFLLQLWNKEVFKKEANAYFSGFVLKFSRYFVYGTIVIALCTFIFWYFNDFSKAFYALTSVLLVACPCALALSLPFALGNSLSKMGKKGLYLRSVDTVEQLSEIDTIVFDKTGTLTEQNKSKIEFIGAKLSDRNLIIIKSAVKSSTHPLSKKIYDSILGNCLPVDLFEEKPSKGLFCLVMGTQVEIGSAFWVGYEEEINNNETRIYVSLDGIVKGYFKISNSYRTNVFELLKELSKKYELHVLSGDNDNEKNNLSSFFVEKGNLKFYQSPQDKYDYIENLQRKGKKVMMVGDGLNDAGALKLADIGLAVSENVFSFSPSCDGILEGNAISKLNLFLNFSKSTVSVIKGSLVVSLMYNMVGLFFAVQGILTPVVAAILMPLSSISVVLFVIVTTNWFSRSLNSSGRT